MLKRHVVFFWFFFLEDAAMTGGRSPPPIFLRQQTPARVAHFFFLGEKVSHSGSHGLFQRKKDRKRRVNASPFSFFCLFDTESCGMHGDDS